MPKKPIERAREDEREGKAPSTQAGEFVREEIDLIREGAHGARSTKQAIAIGLSKARRAGVKLPPPKKRIVSEETRKKAITRPRKSAGRWPANVAKTFTSHAQGAQARRPRRRVETSTLEARPLGRSRQERCRTLRRREKGRSNSREAISRAHWSIYSAENRRCVCDIKIALGG